MTENCIKAVPDPEMQRLSLPVAIPLWKLDNCIPNISTPVIEKKMEDHPAPVIALENNSDSEPRSDFDDSDADPTFRGSSCESSDSKSSSESDASTSSSSDTENDSKNVEARTSEKDATQSKSNTDEEALPNKGKKRMSTPITWYAKKVKLLRNSGQEYVSVGKSRKTVEARKVGPPCSDKCRFKCSEKIPNEERHQLFKAFYALADLHKQREFVARHTTVIIPKYRYSCTNNLRKLNSAFFFEVNGQRIRVCKTFFSNTLDFKERSIRTVLAKKTDTGFLEEEKRGKHGKQPTVDPEIKESVRSFIRNIPRIESHYLRAQTTREFIESGKNLSDLYRDYKEERENEGKKYANQVMFNRIFNTDFNISFFIPKKDQCDFCERMKNCVDDEKKKEIEERYNAHLQEKELSRQEKDVDKVKPNVACYDLQAVMPLPKGFVSSFYYKSKINCYNFTITDLKVQNVECYFWTELEGRCGANEIGSAVLRYIELLIHKAGSTATRTFFQIEILCRQILHAQHFRVQSSTSDVLKKKTASEVSHENFRLSTIARHSYIRASNFSLYRTIILLGTRV
jgi:hypothetical protein